MTPKEQLIKFCEKLQAEFENIDNKPHLVELKTFNNKESFQGRIMVDGTCAFAWNTMIRSGEEVEKVEAHVIEKIWYNIFKLGVMSGYKGSKKIDEALGRAPIKYSTKERVLHLPTF